MEASRGGRAERCFNHRWRSVCLSLCSVLLLKHIRATRAVFIDTEGQRCHLNIKDCFSVGLQFFLFLQTSNAEQRIRCACRCEVLPP